MLPPIDLVAPPVLVAPFNVLVNSWIGCPCAALHLRSCPHSLRAHTSLSPVVRQAASFIPCETKFCKMTIFQPNCYVAIFTWLGLAERSIKFHKNHPLRDLFSTSLIIIGNWESMESRHRLPICTSNLTIRVTIHVLISYIFSSCDALSMGIRYRLYDKWIWTPWLGFSGQRLTYWKSLISITQLFLIKIWLSKNRWGWVKI